MAYGFKLDRDGAYDLVTVVMNDSTIYGIGDAVILAGSSASALDRRSAPTVTRASAGDTNAIYGVVVSVDQMTAPAASLSLTRRHRPASVTMEALVARAAPGKRFIIVPDAALAATDIGSVANLATIADANTTTGYSTMALSASSKQASGNATYQLRIVDFVDTHDGDKAELVIGTDIVPVIVEINNIQGFHATAGY